MLVPSSSAKDKSLSESDFATLIPLRGGSKGIPRKNLRLLKGSPLFSYVSNASIQAGLKTYVSTEDEEIKNACKEYCPMMEIINRPYTLASDIASTEDVISHFLDIESRIDHIVLLQATSPLTTSMDIKNAISHYIKEGCKPLVSVVKRYNFLWNRDGSPINYIPNKRPRRQEFEPFYQENGAIYIFSRDHFDKTRCRCSLNSTLFNMPSNTAIEIDDESDFEIISQLMEEE